MHAETVSENAFHQGISRNSAYQVNTEGSRLSWLGLTSEELGEGRGHCWVAQTEHIVKQHYNKMFIKSSMAKRAKPLDVIDVIKYPLWL